MDKRRGRGSVPSTCRSRTGAGLCASGRTASRADTAITLTLLRNAVGLRSPALKEKEEAMASIQSEVRALLESWSEAARIKDIDRLMSLYSPDIVY
jgi:hypothetical protein